MHQIENGLVIKSTGSIIHVKLDSGAIKECKVSGRFRIKDIKNTNPVAVGDHVQIEIRANEALGLITEIAPRRNYIIRKSINLSRQAHIIASNIDLALIVVTLKEPRTSTGFIDRFLVTCEAYSIPAYIVLNKTDLYQSKEDIDAWAELQYTYETAGYEILPVSAANKQNTEQLLDVMRGKICLFSGHSGVGKSALVNTLNPMLNQRIGEISDVHAKGKHTTTFAELLEIAPDTYIIDTPGIKELGLIDMEKTELDDYFPEIFKYAQDCKYNSCLHENEPGCAVKQAVEDDLIAPSRYVNYIGMLHSEELQKKWPS
ncbi:MAG: ribosome small subunit-dependent GTPase A [Flavobacteriales bacterium]